MTSWGLMYQLSIKVQEFFHWILLLGGHENLGCLIIAALVYFEIYGIWATLKKAAGK